MNVCGIFQRFYWFNTHTSWGVFRCDDSCIMFTVFQVCFPNQNIIIVTLLIFEIYGRKAISNKCFLSCFLQKVAVVSKI